MTTLGYIIGSVSAHSINRRLATALVSVAPQDLEMVEIPIAELPRYNPDHDDCFPEAAQRLKQLIERVDGVVLLSPEYNRTIPSVLKDAIDFASRPWGASSWPGKPVAILGAGLNGAGTAVAQAHLRSVLGYCGAHVVGHPETCITWTPELVGPDGSPSPRLHDILTRFLTAVTAQVRVQAH